MGCPADVQTQSADGQALAVTYGAPTTSGGTPPVTTACVPESGSMFAVGASQVACTATDAAAEPQQAACSFMVSVLAPPPPPMLSVTRFMAFGDSITAGVISPAASFLAADRMRAYPFVLRGMLEGAFPDQEFTMQNSGQSDERAQNALSRFQFEIQQRQPDVVMLMEGTNDLFDGLAAAIPPTIDALRQMVQFAQAMGVDVLLASIPPQPEASSRQPVAVVIPSFNDGIRMLAMQEGVVFVDVFGAMDLSLIGSDNLHPTVEGNVRIAETFLGVIVQTFSVTGSPDMLRRRF